MHGRFQRAYYTKKKEAAKTTNASARNPSINDSPASLANNPTIKQAQPNPEWEPEDCRKNAQDPKSRGRDVTTLLQADHLRVVRRQGSTDHVACDGVLVMIGPATGHCICI